MAIQFKPAVLRSVLAAALLGGLFAGSAHASGDAVKLTKQDWSFDGIFGTYDRSALKRGFQIYSEVCISCHALNLVAYRNLSEIGLEEDAIKEYAAEYGFDWRLISAMAFQESGFDHKKVSPKGAVGVMQVRPETAADPKVGIPDISSVANNIQAGVKYLKYLQDQYFDDAAILPQDQVRFSLAAYNAGPGRMRRARRKAIRMQLDPNRWFRNVEIAMLKIVGQETVRYVSNINKYYVIYSNAYEQVEKREAAIQRVKKDP